MFHFMVQAMLIVLVGYIGLQLIFFALNITLLFIMALIMPDKTRHFLKKEIDKHDKK